VQGVPGTSGTSGTSSTSGTSGSSGTSGTKGDPGTSGTSGTSGENGSSGSSGTSSTSGSSGSSGRAGIDGLSGSSGSSGTSGTSGTSGSSGTAGTSGSSVNLAAPGAIGETTPSTIKITQSKLVASTGGLSQNAVEATKTLSGATSTITLNIPANSRIVGCQLRVDTEITSDDGGASFAAAYTGGASGSICATETFDKNNKINSMTTEVTTDITNILITCSGGKTFSAGVIRAIVYYEGFIDMDDAP